MQFISFKPLIGSVGGVDFCDIYWVVVGRESGPESRTLDIGWVEEIFNQRDDFDVHSCFKQWGGENKKRSGRTFNGRTWNEMPDLCAQT